MPTLAALFATRRPTSLLPATRDTLSALLAKTSVSCAGQVVTDSTNQSTDSYPHRYNNYEGFNFPTPAPWYEYPIMKTYAVYTGGSPGPDRVIFDSNGAFDKLITHTGASGNAFVACT